MKKNTFYTVVLLLAGAVMAACSGGDDMTSDITPEQQMPTEDVVVELVGTLGKGSVTRNIDEWGNDYWEVGNQFAIYYETANGHATAIATVYAIHTGGYSADFKATLINPKTGNNAVTLVYPASAHDGKGGFKTDALMDQDGTLEGINDRGLDIQRASTTMNVEETNATLKSEVTLQPQVCICSMLFYKNLNPERSFFFQKMEISDGTHKYTITSPDYFTGFTVALLPVSNASFTFTAASIEKADKCTLYSYVKDFEPANITSSDIGNVILPDNKVYECSLGSIIYSGNFTATLEAEKWYKDIKLELEPAGSISPVAMIAYVGSETGEENNVSPLTAYKHGLAIAMKDANNSNCQWKVDKPSTGCDNNYQWEGGSSGSAASESGLQYRNARMTEDWPAFNACARYSVAGYDPAEHGCSPWFLCSAYQWDQILAACKDVKGLIYNGWIESYEEISGLRDAFSSRGGENIKGQNYWSCTERSAYSVYVYNFNDLNEWLYSGWYYGSDKTGGGSYVRSVFAF